MRNPAVGAARGVFNVLYKMANRAQRNNVAVFLSRQTDEPSYDFQELAREFQARGWDARMHLKKVGKRNLLSYCLHVLREIKLLGICKIVVLDRYDPVVSLIDFECEPVNSQDAGYVNHDFPKKPVVLQLWHAFGAYKRFGHQSVGTPEGHNASFTSTFNIHRNYSWVVCSGEAARAPFAEAFGCPKQRVIAMDRPEYDELIQTRQLRDARKAHPHKVRVLMAPTLRINDESAHPFRDLYQQRNEFEAGLDAEIVWSFHPLEDNLPAPGNVSENLVGCDVLVTDYSSIVYEACLLGIPVIFHIPDVESYRVSPGLNADPAVLCPGLCTYSSAELSQRLSNLIADLDSYPTNELQNFASAAFDIDTIREGSAASRLVDFLLDKLGE